MPSSIYCAVDTADLDHALTLARQVAPHVGGIKLGLEFWNRFGADGVQRVAETLKGGSLFLDLKLHDIPNTVAGAVRALVGVPHSLLTVHASGGVAMMSAAWEAAAEDVRIVGVTVLTSLDEADLQAGGVSASTGEQAARLAGLAREAGLDGVVCSPHEVAALRRSWPQTLLVVPGIRPEGADVGDQKRVMTPAEAQRAGADILVIGRPITNAPDPAAAAAHIAGTLT